MLMSALRRRPPAGRSRPRCTYLVDLPIDEVAATLGISVGTVKSRLSRGRAALAVLLRDDVDVTFTGSGR